VHRTAEVQCRQLINSGPPHICALGGRQIMVDRCHNSGANIFFIMLILTEHSPELIIFYPGVEQFCAAIFKLNAAQSPPMSLWLGRPSFQTRLNVHGVSTATCLHLAIVPLHSPCKSASFFHVCPSLFLGYHAITPNTNHLPP